MKRSFLLVGFVLLVIALPAASQQTIYVPDDYPTIQAAIDAAQPGDTVSIEVGEYTENLLIDKPLRLVGSGRATAQVSAEDPERPVISITSDEQEVSLETLAVFGGTIGVRIECGVKGSVRLVETLILSNETGLTVASGGSVSVVRSSLVHNDYGAYIAAGCVEMVDSEVVWGIVGLLLGGDARVKMSGCLVGLAEIAINTYTIGCGWRSGAQAFTGVVEGEGNRVFGNLCPLYPGAPWPEDFFDIPWRLAIAQILAGFVEGLGAHVDQAYSEAHTAYMDSLALFEREAVSFPIFESYILHYTGVVEEQLGRYEEALEKLHRARAVYAERGMKHEVSEIDCSIGNILVRLGQYHEALAAYRSARVVSVERNLETEVASIDQNIGVVCQYLGRFDEALAALQSARAIFIKHNQEVNVALVDQNIGIVYSMVGRPSEALAVYQSVRPVFAEHDMHVDVAKIDQNIGIACWNLGLYDEALTALRIAQEIYVSHAMDVSAADIDHCIGNVYLHLGHYEDALEAYQSARSVYVDREMYASIAETENCIGNVYLNLAHYEDALKVFLRALDYLNEAAAAEDVMISNPATRWMIHSNMGIVYEALNEWDMALIAYEDSITVIESIRSRLTSEDLKRAWQERTQLVYGRLISLLYRMGEGSSAFPYVERCRARTFLDMLYSGGISPDQLISPEEGVSSGAVDVSAIRTSITTAQDMLRINEAVLEYMVTESGVYLWVITSTDGISDPIYVEYSRQELMREVIELRQELESLHSDVSSVYTTLGSLYEQLVQPALALLGDEVDTLVFIPSGPLWYVPFSSLTMTDHPDVEIEGGTGLFKQYRPMYLLEAYTLAFLPSLASLPALMDDEAVESGTSLLVLANPALTMGQVGDLGLNTVYFGALEEAARAFALCYVGSDDSVHTDTDAQEARAYGQTGPIGVEVYACHGSFNSYVPLQSKLLLGPGCEEGASSDDDPRVPDGDYHAWEAMLTDHHGAELVVLAACETILPAMRDLGDRQLERIVIGDEVVGLARAFLSSGAQSVLGTLWQATPRAVEQLLTAMCRYHQQGMTWAQSLGSAQQEVIANPDYDDVWFWAPYQLIGMWR